MKYVCTICGYIYDDEKENVKFEDLPDTWKCPMCGAAKSDFKKLEDEPINNETENNYEKPVITDIIDTSLVTFIDGSVTIDGTKATSSEYKYDEQTHTLTVNLDTITPSSSSTLTFLVKKKS